MTADEMQDVSRHALAEIERIRDERAASQKWNALPEAQKRRHALYCAAEVLKISAKITYYET